MRPETSKKTILLVDDDRGIVEALQTILVDEGYAVAVAENGAEALAQLREHPRPSLILLDLMMPVMDGYAFRTEQLGDDTIAGIPVLVGTAGAIDERIEVMRVQGCFKKPFDLDALLARIAECV